MKYEPLKQFLMAGTGAPLTLSFVQIRLIVPDIAPSHSLDQRWWLNEDPSHSQSRAWGEAGYTASPELCRGQVTFRPVKPSSEVAE